MATWTGPFWLGILIFKLEKPNDQNRNSIGWKIFSISVILLKELQINLLPRKTTPPMPLGWIKNGAAHSMYPVRNHSIMPEGDLSSTTSFVTLLTEHQGDLRAFILSLMPGNPDARDVLQKTNVVLWEKRNSFQEGTNFRAWALTCARFTVLDYLKRRKGKSFVFLDDDLIPPEPRHRMVPHRRARPWIRSHNPRTAGHRPRYRVWRDH